MSFFFNWWLQIVVLLMYTFFDLNSSNDLFVDDRCSFGKRDSFRVTFYMLSLKRSYCTVSTISIQSHFSCLSQNDLSSKTSCFHFWLFQNVFNSLFILYFYLFVLIKHWAWIRIEGGSVIEKKKKAASLLLLKYSKFSLLSCICGAIKFWMLIFDTQCCPCAYET